MARLLAVLVLLRAARPLPTPTPGNNWLAGTPGAGSGVPAGFPAALSSAPPRPAGSPQRCPPEQFHCSEPYDLQTDCYPLEWLCDGHPDCSDGWDERGCGTSGSTAAPTACGTDTARPSAGAGGGLLGGTEASAVPAPGRSLPSRNQGRMWMLIVAVLLSCLVAAGGIAAWGKSKAKSRSDIFRLKYASREQLVPDRSQADLLS
ncbi:CD320 antigen [Cyrtonyx montezumae]|uniref:CD320 antigen n=1 Tax=Cyrtonyx montezumae TaxID=9017 RepID=UPI0032DBC0FA